MTDKTVDCEVSNGVARIILNRPTVNALNLEMIQGVVAAFEIAGDDDGIRAIVLTSAVSKAFSAGLDLNILLGKSEEKVRELLQELYVRLYDTQYNLGKPSIAAERRAVVDDHGHLMRCHPGGTKRDVWIPRDRCWRYSGDTFHSPSSHRRSPPCFRVVVFWAELRRRRSIPSRPCQQDRARRGTGFPRASNGRNICCKISCRDAPRPRCIYAPKRP
jgi:hypothetical protein